GTAIRGRAGADITLDRYPEQRRNRIPNPPPTWYMMPLVGSQPSATEQGFCNEHDPAGAYATSHCLQRSNWAADLSTSHPERNWNETPNTNRTACSRVRF